MASREDTIHNEQLKLAATALNNIGVASIVTGVIVPMIGHASSSAMAGSRYWAWFMALWLAFGVGVHVIGRRLLKGLRP